jgi:hypothetical protein
MIHLKNVNFYNRRQHTLPKLTPGLDQQTSNNSSLTTIPKKCETNIVSIDGFSVICSFHQLVGLPYYSMSSSCNVFRSVLGISFSLSFIAIFIGEKKFIFTETLKVLKFNSIYCSLLLNKKIY